MVSKSCGFNTLCGISVRFQTLSPSERQVAHALLTRPPLTFIPEGNQSVRLACVRHAASVRPEPGSNSLKIVSKQLPKKPLKSFSELLALTSSDVLVQSGYLYPKFTVANFHLLKENLKGSFFVVV